MGPECVFGATAPFLRCNFVETCFRLVGDLESPSVCENLLAYDCAEVDSVFRFMQTRLPYDKCTQQKFSSKG